MSQNQKLLLGAHMSISGGLYKSFNLGESIGCTAIQIFTKSNRQWAAKKISEEEAAKFQQCFKESPIESVIVHASYLINIGSSNKELYEKSINGLKDELLRCDQLNLKYLILHPGSSQESNQTECMNLIAQAINHIFEQSSGKTIILLENTAGQGTSVGYTFEQLAHIYENIKNKHRIGFCFDTCHAFAAGYNFSSKESYKNMWQKFDNILGIKNLKAMHINDSKKDCGSKVDRHEHIGNGKIGIEAFKLLFNDEKFFEVPKILETPYETIQDYVPDMKTIVNLFNKENQKMINGTGLEQYLKI